MMKKVARMRLSSEEMSHGHSSNSEHIVRTTGRIKKPKAVFDPSDNYLPKAQQRSLIAATALSSSLNNSSLERRASYTKASTVSPIVPTEPKDACVVCKKKESKRPSFAQRNPLIICKWCSRKIHKLCLNVDFEDFESIQHNYTCDKCRTCRICDDIFSTDEEDVTCSKCAKSFHVDCFPTKIIKTDNMRDWKCNQCQVYNQITNGTTLPVKKIREIIGGGEPPAVTNAENLINSKIEKSDEISKNEQKPDIPLNEKTTSPDQQCGDNSNVDKSVTEEINSSPEKRKKKSNQSPDLESGDTVSKTDSASLYENENFDDIPDVKEWSVEQVYEYFYKHFPKEAHVFKSEEIDGRSLLLLKRSDVVKKLPIKLGPSLRIYSLILKIQAQLNDPTLGWNCGL